MRAARRQETRKETNSTLVEQLIALGVTPEELGPSKVNLNITSPSLFVKIINVLAYLFPVILLEYRLLVRFPAGAGQQQCRHVLRKIKGQNVLRRPSLNHL